jgi:hypothetical protein
LPIFGRFVPQIISPIRVAASSAPEDAGGHGPNRLDRTITHGGGPRPEPVPHHRRADDDKRDAGPERPRRHRRSHRSGMLSLVSSCNSFGQAWQPPLARWRTCCRKRPVRSATAGYREP